MTHAYTLIQTLSLLLLSLPSVTMTCCKYEKFGLLETIQSLPSAGWYYGNISVAQAERLLKDEPNGAFLVRDSSDSNSITDLYTITFKIHNRFGSVRVDYSKGYFSLSLLDPGLPLFRTMMDLISFCYNCSVVQKHPVCVLTGHHQDVHLYLTKPVTRKRQMHSLQYLCREAIHSYVTQDKLDRLGLPKRLVQHYISQNPFYDEQLFPIEERESESEQEVPSANAETQSTGSRNSLQLDTGNLPTLQQ